MDKYSHQILPSMDDSQKQRPPTTFKYINSYSKSFSIIVIFINIVFIICLITINVQQNFIKQLTNKSVQLQKIVINKLNELVRNEQQNIHKNLLYKKQFSETPHTLQFHPTFKWYHRNHAHYLLKQNVQTVLEFNCLEQCIENYDIDTDYQQLNATFYSEEIMNSLNKTYDWVVIRYNASNQKQAFYFAQRFTSKAKKGVTILFSNLIEYRKFNSNYRSMLFELMSYYKLEFDEMISLNLRLREGKVLLVFSTQVKRSTFPFPKPIKNQIAVQLPLKFQQNLPYLRQWIGYHIYLGIDKFFFYDNNGSIGEIVRNRRKSNQTTNKYGFDFKCFNLTNNDIIEQWEDIWEQYYEHIIYVPWQPLTKTGQIFFGLIESMRDFINNFEDVTAYIGYLDSDQMLFSQNNLNFSQYITQKSMQGYTRIRLHQKKFINRFCVNNSRILQLNESFEMNTTGWAEKQFFETLQYYPDKSPHHGKTFTGKEFVVKNQKDWRINHYNLLENMIVNCQRNQITNETKLSYDNSGKRYDQILDEICKNRCTENFTIKCQLKNMNFKCPISGKEYPLPEIENIKN